MDSTSCSNILPAEIDQPNYFDVFPADTDQLNYFDTLPTEIIQKILSLTRYSDRLKVDLLCKRFSDITRKFEDKMHHRRFQEITIILMPSQVENQISQIEVALEDEETCYFSKIKKTKDFFCNLRKLELSKSKLFVSIEFSKHFDFLFELTDEIQKVGNIHKLLLKYTGQSETYNDLGALNAGWTNIINDTFALSLKISFCTFAIRFKCYKLPKPINLGFETNAYDDNFDVTIWRSFLRTNNWNTVQFLSREVLDISDLSGFITFILEEIEAGSLSGFCLFLMACKYSYLYLRGIKREMMLFNYKILEFKIDDKTIVEFSLDYEDEYKCEHAGIFQISFVGEFNNE
uniref:F-box domain-containing protein n=1 Tax=Rhabditophanes sp. KR3021 TaxID=114890 RepID=A0AC35TX65_9BILA